MRIVVAIDGPSGAGKSTVARGVAGHLGLEVLDTGAMYRAVTLAAIERGTDLADGAALGALARAVRLEVGPGVHLDGRDVGTEIRGPAVTASVPVVSSHPEVRRIMVERQRAWVEARGGRGVVEGRDIGTVVFPDATVKVFLTAARGERARRRHRDEVGAARAVEVAAVQEQLTRRDTADASLGRATTADDAAADALVVDTTGVGVDEVVAEIVARARAALTSP